MVLVFAPDRRDCLMRPTIVLVHGAFAESASWDGVVDRLLADGHDVVAAMLVTLAVGLGRGLGRLADAVNRAAEAG